MLSGTHFDQRSTWSDICWDALYNHYLFVWFWLDQATVTGLQDQFTAEAHWKCQSDNNWAENPETRAHKKLECPHRRIARCRCAPLRVGVFKRPVGSQWFAHAVSCMIGSLARRYWMCSMTLYVRSAMCSSESEATSLDLGLSWQASFKSVSSSAMRLVVALWLGSATIAKSCRKCSVMLSWLAPCYDPRFDLHKNFHEMNRISVES